MNYWDGPPENKMLTPAWLETADIRLGGRRGRSYSPFADAPPSRYAPPDVQRRDAARLGRAAYDRKLRELERLRADALLSLAKSDADAPIEPGMARFVTVPPEDVPVQLRQVAEAARQYCTLDLGIKDAVKVVWVRPQTERDREMERRWLSHDVPPRPIYRKHANVRGWFSGDGSVTGEPRRSPDPYTLFVVPESARQVVGVTDHGILPGRAPS